MRIFPDRFWWLKGSAGILLIGGSLANLVGSVLQIITGHLFLDAIWKSPLAWIITLVLGLYLIRGAIRSRADYHRRLSALQGDQQALPLVAIEADHSPDQEPRDESIELLWHATQEAQRTYLIISAVFGLILLVLFSLGMVLLVPLLFGIQGVWRDPVQSPFEWIARQMLVGSWLIGSLLGLLYFARLSIGVLGRPTGVISNLKGLTYVPKFGSSWLLRWEEIRFWEVDHPRGETRRYRLYGDKGIVQWSEMGPSRWISLGDLTFEEFQKRHQALLNLIVARTQLMPRTLDKKLMVKEVIPTGPLL
jgi:hypothetical protein